MLVDASNKEMRAIDVFKAAIKHMKEFLMKELTKRGYLDVAETK